MLGLARSRIFMSAATPVMTMIVSVPRLNSADERADDINTYEIISLTSIGRFIIQEMFIIGRGRI